MSLTETDLIHLRRCVALASEALDDGDEPFGSVLVDGSGRVLFEDRNRVKQGDHTRHPEFEIARWAAERLTPEERSAATVYTSGEHCPMCAAAHGWVGLGRIVYAASSEQLTGWLNDWAIDPGPVAPLPITKVVPSAQVEGPTSALTHEVRALHRAFHFRPSPVVGPTSVGSLDLHRYLGLWHEVGRLPLKYEDPGNRDVTATYTLADDGAVNVDNRSLSPSGEPVQAVGRATLDPAHPGRLTVSFLPAGLRWLPFTHGDYWVLKIDSEYNTALVGTPDHRNLWLLSRTPEIDPMVEEQFLIDATKQGFDLRRWIRPAQSGGRVTDSMLRAS